MADAIDDGLIKALEAIAAVVEDYERDGYSDRYNDDEAILGRVQWKSADYPDLPPRVTWGQLKAIREALSRHKAPLSVAGDDVERLPPTDSGDDLRLRIAKAISIPQHHTTWDILSEREKDLFLMQADYVLTALQVTEGDKVERLREALLKAREFVPADAIKTHRLIDAALQSDPGGKG